jgi:putative ABC transport system permease protein
LACLGLHSLASYITELRTKEIGIRKVIGASRPQIIGLLSKQYLLLVMAGFAVAFPVSWYLLQQWLESFAYHVDFSVLLIGACGFISMLIALLAVGYQALKAAGANPVDSLEMNRWVRSLNQLAPFIAINSPFPALWDVTFPNRWTK